MSISSSVVPVGSLWLGALRAIFENSEYSDLGLKSRKATCFALGSRSAQAHLRRRLNGTFYLVTQFLGYEQALIRGACTVLSATRSESALRTDFEFTQQLYSDQSA